MDGHPNSWRSYETCLEGDTWHRVVWKIARFYHRHEGEAFTDRQVKDLLLAEGVIAVDDMNMVRPKITHLIDEGFLVEHGDTLDTATHRHVRLVTWSPHAVATAQEQQRELFA